MEVATAIPVRTRSRRTCGRGASARLADLLQPLRPGEESDGETTRLGAYAARLWLPMLRAGGRRLMRRFDLLGPLPAERSTTVLEASAGTGKTFALAGLVTRYVAEGVATLDQMLLITFGRAATQELRERVRRQIVGAVAAFDDPSTIGDNQLVAHLLNGTEDERKARRQRLRDALAGFDAATIATTHQFCQLVLKSLGVAGDTDAGVTLVESLDELVTEIVDDLYLAHFGQERDEPLLTYADALRLAREVVKNPATELRPLNPSPARAPRSASTSRKTFWPNWKPASAPGHPRLRRPADPAGRRAGRRRLARPGADASAVADRDGRRVPGHRPGAVAGDRPRVHRRSTLILIGDPKQAIYAFRGGDIVTYLRAAETAGDKQTLGTNWRSDGALVDRLQAVLRGAELGDPAIMVHDVEAHHQGHRLAGAPHNDPFRLRVVREKRSAAAGSEPADRRPARTHPADLAADIGALLASGATLDGRPLQARDIAVIVEKHKDARCCLRALTEAGIPAVYTGDSDVFKLRGRRGLAVPAGGVRPAAPPRHGAGRRGDDVLRRDRRTPRRRR